MYHETFPFRTDFPIKNFTMSGLSRNTGINFEKRIAEMFFVLGWRNIMYTTRTGDGGADILATDTRGKKWVIQCKRYSHTVSSEAIAQVLLAVMTAYKNGDAIMVITTSTFTNQARNTAEELQRNRTFQHREIKLIDREKLSELIDMANYRLPAVNNYFT